MFAPPLVSAGQHRSSSLPALRSARAPCSRHLEDPPLGTSFLCVYHIGIFTISQSHGPSRLSPSCSAIGEVHTADSGFAFIFHTTITIRLSSSTTAKLLEILLKDFCVFHFYVTAFNGHADGCLRSLQVLSYSTLSWREPCVTNNELCACGQSSLHSLRFCLYPRMKLEEV